MSNLADQMTLVGTTFTDDEDRAKSYRVVDVKFSSEYDVVCCFCNLYREAAKNAMKMTWCLIVIT